MYILYIYVYIYIYIYIYMSLRRFGRNRKITPDNKCLIFYIHIWTFNIDIIFTSLI